MGIEPERSAAANGTAVPTAIAAQCGRGPGRLGKIEKAANPRRAPCCACCLPAALPPGPGGGDVVVYTLLGWSART
jgi:hypothetical protein